MNKSQSALRQLMYNKGFLKNVYFLYTLKFQIHILQCLNLCTFCVILFYKGINDWKKQKFKSSIFHHADTNRGGSRGRVQGVRPPPTPPEMTCGFLIQLVFCKKKTMWFIGVEVGPETSAPRPKKNPGSAPDKAAVCQHTVRQETTMARAGMLPFFLFHRKVQPGDSVSLKPDEPFPSKANEREEVGDAAVPCEQRLHFRCVSCLAKSSLCRQPFNFPSCMCEIRHAIRKKN